MYRRADVELVLQIKQLVFGEGLTLAGARRRLEEEQEGPSVASVAVDDALGDMARSRLRQVRPGLEAILQLLSRDSGELANCSSCRRRLAAARSCKRVGTGQTAFTRAAKSASGKASPRRRDAVASGCSAAWLARLLGVQEVPGSNPGIPTNDFGPILHTRNRPFHFSLTYH